MRLKISATISCSLPCTNFLLAKAGSSEAACLLTGFYTTGNPAIIFDDIEGVKRRLTERGVPFSDYGTWAIPGWQQIFFHDPEGNIIEVHQVGEPATKA